MGVAPRAGREAEALEPWLVAGGRTTVWLLWEAVWQFFVTQNSLPYNPAIRLLDIYPGETKTYVQTEQNKLYMNVHSSFRCNRKKSRNNPLFFGG